MRYYSNSLVETPRHFQGLEKLRYKWIRDIVGNKKVLELGSGFGKGAIFLAKAGAKKVVGIDYARHAVKMAKNINKLGNLEFRLLNVMELNYLNSKFDIVVAFELLEHLDQQQQHKLVKLISRVIKPGGKIVMSTPNRLVFSRGRKKSRYPFHKHELIVEELKDLFGKYFKRVKIKGVLCTNRQHLRLRRDLNNSFKHKLIEWLASYSFVHYLLPLIPKNIKTWVTGEAIFPELKEGDYRLTNKNIELCEDLWVEARI